MVLIVPCCTLFMQSLGVQSVMQSVLQSPVVAIIVASVATLTTVSVDVVIVVVMKKNEGIIKKFKKVRIWIQLDDNTKIYFPYCE